MSVHKGFIGYPVDHLLAAFRDPTDAAAAAAALTGAGVTSRDITVLRGDEGATRLDGTGASNGRLAQVRRVVSFTLMDQLPDFAWYEHAVRDGGAVLMIRIRGGAAQAKAVATLTTHHAHFINHYGRFATEEVVRWQGPEPDLPSLLRR